MGWELTDEVETFAATTGTFLRSRPVEHTVLLTLVDTLRRRGRHTYGPDDPVFGWWRTAGGALDGVLLQTPPHPVLFSALPGEALPAAAEALAGRPLPGVNLTAGAVDAFVGEWRRRTGVTTRVTRRTRLYRLDRLVAPRPMPLGLARYAGPADRDLLIGWTLAFHDEIGEPRPEDPGAHIDDRLSYAGVLLWEDGGRPGAMVVSSPPAAGMVRVQAVYTPPASRGRGYAGAATAAASQAALDSGARDVVLHTDLANPTSNGLYQRLGYRPVEDRVIVEFTA